MIGTLSVMGMYQIDNTILDGITYGLPDVSSPTLEDVKNNILLDCAELEVVISNPALLKAQVANWARRKARGWARYYAAIAADYNPIENYDRQESYSENEIGSNGSTVESGGTSNETQDFTRTPNLTTENKVSAYNENTYQPHDQHLEAGTDRNAGSKSGRSSVNSESSGEYSRSNMKSNRIHGNIGVTTSQQMVAAELDLVDRLDFSQKITDDFKREFCLLVY